MSRAIGQLVRSRGRRAGERFFWPVSPLRRGSLLQMLRILLDKGSVWKRTTETRAAPREENGSPFCLGRRKTAAPFSKEEIASFPEHKDGIRRPHPSSVRLPLGRRNSLSPWLVIMVSAFPVCHAKRVAKSTSKSFFFEILAPIADRTFFEDSYSPWASQSWGNVCLFGHWDRPYPKRATMGSRPA
ncbi:hypothetical protein GWK47_046237 [Chionoecetes opilio]|uniref:Uncharacterized protein n=1 Tax=Chionoecetes opilio TaxID=41210 RepID=A0A8J4Y4X2_CHIOP|nr:hypothetical protein GWK47_046237 [Chionoecetes opilio]